MAQTSIHFQAVKGGSEEHNKRTKKLDYVHHELSSQNDYWQYEKKLELFGDLTIGVMGFLRPGQAIISDCGAKAKVAFIKKHKLGKVVDKRKINYGSYYVVEFNLARLAQLDPDGTERYLIENGLDPKEFKAN